MWRVYEGDETLAAAGTLEWAFIYSQWTPMTY